MVVTTTESPGRDPKVTTSTGVGESNRRGRWLGRCGARKGQSRSTQTEKPPAYGGAVMGTETAGHQRMAKMVRRAVHEVSEIQAEARAEQRRHEELLADMAARREALETGYEETTEKLEAELAGLRADAQQEREQLLADVKQRAGEATQQRIKVLEQLMGVYRDLEAVPGALEAAYQELKNLPEQSVIMPLDEKISTG
jgi:peptide subunit release factor 1 (eRF1)